jgi:ATP-dependent 26S proteasome regulatory subunit
MLAAGRHLKRGVLLHGPPGTGKTTTAMYLVAAMPGRTVVILSGDSLGLIEPACALARDLEPAMVVLEDVDLVAQDRMFDGSGPVLFELLNEMDGLAADADILFLLTTNRPDVLEPALAARPGRIDEAVELPLPDADGLSRLLALYSEGLEMQVSDLDAVVDRLDGATPAHVKELLRKAALLAAEEREGPIVVEDRHLLEALDDLSAAIDRIKQRLFEEDEPGEDDFPFPP